jgi:hypothetical protein
LTTKEFVDAAVAAEAVLREAADDALQAQIVPPAVSELVVDADLEFRGGFRVLVDDPVLAQHAASKAYVDANAGGGTVVPVTVYQEDFETMANNTFKTVTHGLDLPLSELSVRVLLQTKVAVASFPINTWLDATYMILNGSSSSTAGGLGIIGVDNNTLRITTA